MRIKNEAENEKALAEVAEIFDARFDNESIRTFVCNPIATWREVYENAEQNGTTGVTQPSTDGN